MFEQFLKKHIVKHMYLFNLTENLKSYKTKINKFQKMF